jgi:signal transduction histidine kinase
VNGYDLINLDKIEYLEDIIANPGAFLGEVDSFEFTDDNSKHIFDKASDYKKIIQDLSGIRVYRDGFAIRVEQDWLKLGEQQTTGGSYYGLRPKNTLGYISLTARDNLQLEETTNRENFKDTIYFRNFFLLMKQFVKFTALIQEKLRRSWNNFCQLHRDSLAHVKSTETIKNFTNTLKRKLVKMVNSEQDILLLKNRISENKTESIRVMDELSISEVVSPDLRNKAMVLLPQFKSLLDGATKMLDRLTEDLQELSKIKDLPGIIDNRIEELYQQMDMMYESVALGLTAEALSHEINNILDQLSRRSKSIKIDLEKRNIHDKNILVFIEYVKSVVLAMKKQMSFLSPTLRYVREVRHEINIVEFANELITYYKERLNSNKISLEYICCENANFLIKINKGKLIQVIDNLISMGLIPRRSAA